MSQTAIRRPTPPGEILREEFLCDVKVINRIVNGRCAVSAEMALRLGAALGTSPQFWLSAQQAVDLYESSRAMKRLPGPIAKAG
jgi:antitoxin HigA-1